MDFCIECNNFLFIKEFDNDSDKSTELINNLEHDKYITKNDKNDKNDKNVKNNKNVKNDKNVKPSSLIFYCLKCNYKKMVENNCVYKKIYKKPNNLYKNHKFLNYDVTLPRKIVKCPSCLESNNNVYYQCHNLSIIFTCKKCSHFWNNN